MPEKLSCVACRESKIKCSKETPICNKCVQKGSECIYRSRAPRRRRKSQPLAYDRLGKQEENGASKRHLRELLPRTDMAPELAQQSLDQPSLQREPSNPYTDSPSGGQPGSVGANSIASPFSAWHRDPNGAGDANETASLGLDKLLAHKWVCRVMTDQLFAMFLALVDLDVMKAMPDILDSGYAQFDAPVLIIYYNLVIHGSIETVEPTGPYWRRRLFEQCMMIAPDWTKADKLTDTDFTAAFLMLWTAIAIFDNASRWNIFCQACHIALQLGWNDLESHSGEQTRKGDTRRILFWQLLRIESWFRVFHDKPAVLTAKPWNVSLPSITIAETQNALGATLATVCMVHARLTLVINECYKTLDDPAKTQGEARAALENVIEESHGLLRDWEIEESFSTVQGMKHKMYYADTLFFAHSLVVELTRRLGIHAPASLIPRARHSARRFLRVMLDFAHAEAADTRGHAISLSIVAGNTFSPFFVLRSAALAEAEADRDAARADFELLRHFAQMVQAGVKAEGFVTVEPFAQHLVELSGVRNVNIGSFA